MNRTALVFLAEMAVLGGVGCSTETSAEPQMILTQSGSGASINSGWGGSSTAGVTATAGTAGIKSTAKGNAGNKTGGKGGASGKGGKGGTTAGGTGGTETSAAPGDGCPTTEPSDCEVVSETIIIPAGTTRDYQCKCFKANPITMGNGNQSENQSPVFQLQNGATLLNVIIGSPAADGIHCQGDATLENIVWTDIGEDAMTIKEKGTVILNGGYAANSEDKIFQINAESTFKVSKFKAVTAGKFIRQNGNTTYKITVEIDNCDISNMYEAIFRTDSSLSTVKMTNTRYSNIGKQLFIVPNSSQVTESNNTEY
jgi:pectate lyase C